MTREMTIVRDNIDSVDIELERPGFVKIHEWAGNEILGSVRLSKGEIIEALNLIESEEEFDHRGHEYWLREGK